MKRSLFFSEEGIALMMVLWVLVLLSIVVLNFLNFSRWNSLSTHNLKDETVSYYRALSGYHEAVNYLLSDKDPSFDFSDNEGNFRIDDRTPPVTGKRTVGDGEVDIRIIDEDSKVNINYATPERLRKLLEFAGIREEKTLNEIIDSIQDWKDPDREHHLSGAEDEYYEGLDEPYKTKNALFDAPEELGLVKGITPEYIYGSSEIRPLLPLITTFGSGNININTVSTEVMELMGLNEYEIEAVLKQRSGEAGGFKFVPQQFASYGLNALSSNNLRIEVTAKANNGGPASKITAILSRQPTPKGHRLQPLYWRESVENIRG